MGVGCDSNGDVDPSDTSDSEDDEDDGDDEDVDCSEDVDIKGFIWATPNSAPSFSRSVS